MPSATAKIRSPAYALSSLVSRTRPVDVAAPHRTRPIHASGHRIGLLGITSFDGPFVLHLIMHPDRMDQDLLSGLARERSQYPNTKR
ncbi:hypothetical protein Lesp02_39040 [Lentzea sp. NBRC 105346]|nr:hypothetical protein Lesp02_39040 [Lentzea sp. NBRC 105346]